MNGKIGLAVVLLAAAAFVVSESQAFARHGRRARCGSCCAAQACAGGACEAAAPAEASPSDAPASAQAPAPPAAEKGVAVTPPAETPQSTPSVTSRPSNDDYYLSRRARRRWARR
jgi:hypothetical protein